MKAILAVIIIGIIGFFAYTVMHKKAEPVKTSVVYYYPKTNVYYDVARSQYIYFDSVQKSWKQSKKFSEEQKLSLGEKAVIGNPPSPIWKNNAQDRLVYSVNLYSSGNDLKQKYYVDSVNSLPKPAMDTPKKIAQQAPPIQEKKEKPKSGFKKFLDKIFGGGKDKEPEKKSS